MERKNQPDELSDWIKHGVKMPQSVDARRFFTRLENGLVPCRCLSAVPWRQKTGA